MPVFAMMIAPASRRFFVVVPSYGGTMPSNASAPRVVGMSVVWTLSFRAIGMPCSGPRTRPRARSRSLASASSSALGFTVIAAWSLSSYVAMRVRYCCMIACDVVRPDFIAACISGMLASNTSKAAGLTGALAGRAVGAGAWPVASSRVKMLSAYFMESNLVAADEPDDGANELSLRLLEMRGVVGARKDDPGLVDGAQAREQFGLDGHWRLGIAVAMDQEDRRLQLRGAEGVELVLVPPS